MKPMPIFLLACLALACNHRQVTQAPATDVPPAATPTVLGLDHINAETCVDLVWLLTHYDVARLASGSSPAEGTGYPLACCAKGVLAPDDEYRCEIDWPSSDLPGCDLWTTYHDALAAAYPDQAQRSARVHSNLALLKLWPTQNHHCMGDP